MEPVLFESNAAECSVLKNFNMAKYNGKNSGRIVMIGQGAGRWPTASAVLRDCSDIGCGRRFMMKPCCEAGSADNAGCAHRYLVRVPAGASFPLPVEESEELDGVSYLRTGEVSVSAMHEAVKNLRAEGCSVFFAAIGE